MKGRREFDVLKGISQSDPLFNKVARDEARFLKRNAFREIMTQGAKMQSTKQSAKKSNLSSSNKSSSGPLKSKEKDIVGKSLDTDTAPLTASLGSIVEHKVNEGVSSTHLPLSAEKSSTEESHASWKDTFLMVGGAVVVAALLEGARRLTGKSVDTDSDSDADSFKKEPGEKKNLSPSAVKADFSEAKTSAEPGKRISKNKTALKTKSAYPSQVAGKSKTKSKAKTKSKKAAPVRGASKKASAGGRRSTRAY